jgi:hypothetical protein
VLCREHEMNRWAREPCGECVCKRLKFLNHETYVYHDVICKRAPGQQPVRILNKQWIRILPSKHARIISPETTTKCARIANAWSRIYFDSWVRTLLFLAGSTPWSVSGACRKSFSPPNPIANSNASLPPPIRPCPPPNEAICRCNPRLLERVYESI